MKNREDGKFGTLGVGLDTIAQWLNEEGVKFTREENRIRVIYQTNRWRSLTLGVNVGERFLILGAWGLHSLKGDSPEDTNRIMRGVLLLNYDLVGVKFQLDKDDDIGVTAEYDIVSVSKPEFMMGLRTILSAADQLIDRVLNPIPPPESTIPACDSCGQPLRWIVQYKRWWCRNCKKYAPATLPPPTE